MCRNTNMDGSYGEIWEVENYWVLGIVKRASLLKTEWVDSRHNSSFFDIFEKKPKPENSRRPKKLWFWAQTKRTGGDSGLV